MQHRMLRKGCVFAAAIVLASSAPSYAATVANHLPNVNNAVGLTASVDLSTSGQVNLMVSPIPEPAGFALFGMGVIGFGLYLRRRGSKGFKSNQIV